MKEALNELSEKITEVHELIQKCYIPDRERSLALTKLEECTLWLSQCKREGAIS